MRLLFSLHVLLLSLHDFAMEPHDREYSVEKVPHDKEYWLAEMRRIAQTSDGQISEQELSEKLQIKYDEECKKMFDNLPLEERVAKSDLKWHRLKTGEGWKICCTCNSEHTMFVFNDPKTSDEGLFLAQRDQQSYDLKLDHFWNEISYDVVLSPDEKLCALNAGECLRIIDMSTKKEVWFWQNKVTMAPPKFVFLTNSQLLYTNVCNLYSQNFGSEKMLPLPHKTETPNNIYNLTRIRDGVVAFCSQNSTHFWNLMQNKYTEIRKKSKLIVPGPRDYIALLICNVLAHKKDDVVVYQLDQMQKVSAPKLTVSHKNIGSVVFSPEQYGLLAVGTDIEDHQVFLYDIDSGECVKKCSPFNQNVRSLRWSDDGYSLLAADGWGELWEANPKVLKMILELQKLKKEKKEQEQDQPINTN